ncbi:galanin receptor type 1-like isoform X2 [Oculina patagonica]
MSGPFNNSSTANFTAPTGLPPRSNRTEEVVKMVTFWVIIIVGIMGNSLVIAVVKMFRGMRTTTNYLLVNVAVADITTLLFTAILFLIMKSGSAGSPSRTLASFLCKFITTNTIAIVTLLVTALTLTLLAFERYHALVKPMIMSLRLTTDKIAYVIAGIWLVAIALVTPLFASLDYDSERRSCSHGEANFEMMIYIDCLIVILTVVPFTLIAFCYSQIIYGMYFKNTICGSKSERTDTPEETREKKKLVTLLILLTVVFFVAFIPYGILLILRVSKVNHAHIVYLQKYSQYLTLLNCSVNPFIYAFQSSNYRLAFKVILKKMLCRDVTYEVTELLEMRARCFSRSV